MYGDLGSVAKMRRYAAMEALSVLLFELARPFGGERGINGSVTQVALGICAGPVSASTLVVLQTGSCVDSRPTKRVAKYV